VRVPRREADSAEHLRQTLWITPSIIAPCGAPLTMPSTHNALLPCMTAAEGWRVVG